MSKQLSIKSKTVTSVTWAGSSQAFRIVVQFAVTSVLARLLVPQDIGLIAMMTVFTNLVILFSDLGISAAIVQRKVLSHELLSSSFWTVVVVGMFSSVLLFVLSPLIAKFYTEPILTSLLTLFSLNFLISSLGIIQFAVFTRIMDFRRLAIIEILSVVISGGLAIVLALLGFGIWSLVWQQLVSSLCDDGFKVESFKLET